jgi:hypothetical protein
MAFKPVNEGNFGRIQFANPGDSVTGYYLGSEEIEIKGEPATRHNFKTTTGIASCLGTKMLDEELEKVDTGVLARVTYQGKRKGKTGREYKAFLIEADADDRLAPQ